MKNDWRHRNPAADRRVWNEQRGGRGRKLVWGVGVPAAVAAIALGGLVATKPHLRIALPMGYHAPAAITQHIAPPAPQQVAAPEPEAAEQPGTTRTSRHRSH